MQYSQQIIVKRWIYKYQSSVTYWQHPLYKDLHDILGSNSSLIRSREAILRKGYFRHCRVQEPPPTGFGISYY
jgi:hypothetical protein